MKHLFIILFGLCLINPVYAQSDFDKLFPTLTAPVEGKEYSPKTTEELKALFPSDSNKLPRIFIKNFPDDFKEKGTKELFAKVIGALVLKENEQILSERILFNLLKKKYGKGEKWTDKEAKYFDYLVEKYDATVLKTIPTKINDLVYKIDEIPLSVAITQSAVQTNWGKEKLNTPYAQKGWKDSTHYEDIVYPDLYAATGAYVKEMNATPNYDSWRRIRMNLSLKNTSRGTLQILSALDVYVPEDPFYTRKLKSTLTNHPFLFNYDKITFDD